MKLSSLLVPSTLVVLSLSGCGGQSTSVQGDEGMGERGGSESSGSGGSAATGGSFASGGSAMSRGGGSSSGGRGTGGSAGSGTGGVTACSDAIVASPVNNYSFSSILSFQTITVQPDRGLHFDWSGLTKDLLGHAVDPLTDVDGVDLAVWDLTPEELATKLRGDSLQAADISAIMWFYPEHSYTEASLFEFGAPGPLSPEEILVYFDADSFAPDEHTYTVMPRTGFEMGAGHRMIQAFTLDPASANTLVEVTNTSTRVEFKVDLESHRRTVISPGRGDITIDWTDLEVTAAGDPFDPYAISEVVVARYDESVAELEDRFFDLELIAEDIWRGEITSGTTAALSSLTNAAGEPFAGIDGNGAWFVALRCGYCRNPAPWYLSVLTPCAPGEP